jgi:signal transduction histidine kinase
MTKLFKFDRLSVRLATAFLLAAMLGVGLVAVLAYRSTSSDFNTFLSHVEAMDRTMGGGMMGGMMGSRAFIQAQRDFLDNLGQTLIIAGVGGVLLAIFLSGFFTRQIVRPLDRVTVAARRVAGGDLSQRVDIQGSSELAELGRSFNTMAATLDRDRESRQTMIADIAHELRTPLSILQGNIEAMLDGVLTTDTANLNSLHQETTHLTRLVEDLRTLSLVEAGQLRFQSGATDMKELSSQVIEGFRAPFAQKNVAILLEAPGNLLQAWVDSDRTAQVLRNLLSNALYFTPEGGKVTVKLTSGLNGITVSVSDTGAGISTEHLPHIFDRFYRVDRSRARSTGGSGLGLAIVKQLVEAQNGQVWADSEPSKGSTFSFRLPPVSE